MFFMLDNSTKLGYNFTIGQRPELIVRDQRHGLVARDQRGERNIKDDFLIFTQFHPRN